MGSVQTLLAIPRQSTRYIGRNTEVQDVLSRLESHTRLVTVTGTGGIGKTRLALEVGALAAPHFPAGVAWVELARTSNPQAVPAMVAAALDIPLPADGTIAHRVRETVHQPLLVVLDNCEHLIDAVASLTQDLVTNTAWVCILATSRESLAIPGEQLFPLLPLTVPAATMKDLDALWATESVQLFVDRAELQDPDFQWTAEQAIPIGGLCRRLDGIPLAIELAAAHVRVLSPQDMLERMNNRFSLLKANLRETPTRQQTLTAVFDWSYDLLTEPEQLLWQRLAVFASSFPWDAVPPVAADDQLPPEAVWNSLVSLVDKSIVTASLEHGVTRYHMLETLRDYGREKLAETHQMDKFRERHKDYYASHVRQLVSKMPNNPIMGLTDVDNVIAAFEYSLVCNDSSSALIISAVLAFYAHDNGMLNINLYEGLRRALDTTNDNDMSRDRAFALVGMGFLARALNKVEEAVLLLQQAVRVAQQSEDGLALESSLTHLAQTLPHTESQNKVEALHELLDVSDHWFSTTAAHSMLSQHYLWTGETSLALRHAALCAKVAQDYEGTPYYALALGTLGTAELVAGFPKRAIAGLEKAVALLNNIHHVIWLCDFCLPLARAYQLLDQREQTVRTLEKALRLLIEMDLNNYVNEKSIAWIAWAFVIGANLHMSNIRIGTDHIVNDLNEQPKHLRDQCAAIIAGFDRQSYSMEESTDSLRLSRKEWLQVQLNDLETAQVLGEASLDWVVDNHGLTDRELDVLRALSQGLPNKSIAHALHISESTVRTYLSHAYSKLGVASRTEALIQVRKLGLIDG